MQSLLECIYHVKPSTKKDKIQDKKGEGFSLGWGYFDLIFLSSR
jgi:hypothetical protein